MPGTVPLGRLGTEEEWGWLVAYLASPAGDFFSGTVITLDGARDNWFGSWPPGASGEPPAGTPAATGHIRNPARHSRAPGRHPRPHARRAAD